MSMSKEASLPLLETTSNEAMATESPRELSYEQLQMLYNKALEDLNFRTKQYDEACQRLLQQQEEVSKAVEMQKLGVAVPLNDPNYYRLAAHLKQAYDQASVGKGKERHARASDNTILPFHEQRIVMNAKVHGMGSPCGQVTKKIAEGCDMVRRGEVNRGLVEFHGAINYIAALCIAVESGVKN